MRGFLLRNNYAGTTTEKLTNDGVSDVIRAVIIAEKAHTVVFVLIFCFRHVVVMIHYVYREFIAYVSDTRFFVVLHCEYT